jgi:hypothetical protein
MIGRKELRHVLENAGKVLAADPLGGQKPVIDVNDLIV